MEKKPKPTALEDAALLMGRTLAWTAISMIFVALFTVYAKIAWYVVRAVWGLI